MTLHRDATLFPSLSGRRRSRTPKKPASATGDAWLWFNSEDQRAVAEIEAQLPDSDNTPEAMDALLKANQRLRKLEWPETYKATHHALHLGDARQMDALADESIHLVVTSPPYWTLKEYNAHESQMGAIKDYDAFLDELDRVWRNCHRVLVPGGRVCCVVGDVCLARKQSGRHQVMPLHADIQVRARRLGFDNLTPILWHKIANGSLETEGNGAGFYGKPYQPGAIIKNDVEYVLFLRKGGGYRSVPMMAKALSMLTKAEMQKWFRSIWTDIPGASTQNHPAPFPQELASRLIRMFSFAGDTVLDPFAGTGTTSVAAVQVGRSSIGIEIDPGYFSSARSRLEREIAHPRECGATIARLDPSSASAPQRVHR